MICDFNQIKNHLKLSKSSPVDNSPYRVIQHDTWFDIEDKCGTIVGQCSGQFIKDVQDD